jgi:hypothetical protein
MTVYFSFPCASGGSLTVTVKRLSDGFFWDNSSGLFDTGLTFAATRINLTELTGNYAGIYEGANAFNMGTQSLLRAYVHDLNDGNRVLGELDFATAAGAEVNILPLSSSGNVKSDLQTVLGTVATGLARSIDCLAYGTVGTGSTTTSIVTSAMTPAGIDADQLKGRVLLFPNSTASTRLRSQGTVIQNSTVATLPVLTVDALTNAPANGDVFVIV